MEKEYFEIKGGKPLCGTVQLHAAKNAVLPALAASMLTEEKVTICDCPNITDIDSMCSILTSLGLSVERDKRKISVSGRPELYCVPDYLACAMRSSAYMLGALLSVLGEVSLYTPGGCKIGARPLDIHLDGLSRMGADVLYCDDRIVCKAKHLNGAEIILKYPSVGATENLLLAAVRARGNTTLINCAREPEIVSLCHLLCLMGAQVEGGGTPVIRVQGRESLSGAVFTPCPDRIVAGTLLSAVAVTGGKITIQNCNSRHLGAVITELISPHFSLIDDGSCVLAEGDGIILPTQITTGPYPLFPTDLQAPFTAVQCYATGVSQTTETVFENRFSHVSELLKMGAIIDVDAETLSVKGGRHLRGCVLNASDLRGGAGLVIAALGTRDKSRVYGLRHIDRGYEKLESVFSSLGAQIVRKTEFIP